MTTQELAKISCEVNGGEWPECLGRKVTFHLRPSLVCWWSPMGWMRRLAVWLLRDHIQREMDLAQSIGVIRAIDVAVGRKEVLRYWNTGYRTDPLKMTAEQFEDWWANQ